MTGKVFTITPALVPLSPGPSATVDAWARLTAASQLPIIDGLLAATAAVRNWTLVTRNASDVEWSGVRVLNHVAPAQPRGSR
jgi:hypothetical protein